MKTKNFFCKTAERISEIKSKSARREATEAMADVFAADNPNFKRERFFEACGVDDKKPR